MKKCYRVLVLMLILSTIGGGVFHAVKAENEQIITGFTVTDLQGNPISTVANQYVQFRINATFNITANQVTSGDKTVINLPDALVFYKSDNFEIKDDKGQSIANVEISKETKTLTITYLSYVDEKSDISGEFHIYVIVDEKAVTEKQMVPLDFMVDGEIVRGPEIDYKGPADYKPIPLAKYGYFDKNNPQRINYYVYINTTANVYKDAVINDILRVEGMHYDQNTFRLYTGTWERIGKEWKLKDKVEVTSDYSFQFDGPSFSFEVGDINGEGYYLTYSVDLSYAPVNGEVFQNFASIVSSEEKTVTANVKTTYMVSGSTGSGYNYTLQVHKKDATDQSISLEGATFDVVRIRSNTVVGTITTDNQGLATINNLLYDDYKLVETKAPEGYQLVSSELVVLSTDFDSGTRTAHVQVLNEKTKPQLISLVGWKTWVDNNNQAGLRPDSIELILYADEAVVDVQPQWIKTDDIWQYTYTDLPQFINNQEVSYSVQEVAVSGYDTSYDGYHIINTLIEVDGSTPQQPDIDLPDIQLPDIDVPELQLPDEVLPIPVQPELSVPKPVQPNSTPINPTIPSIESPYEKPLPNTGVNSVGMYISGGLVLCGIGMLILGISKQKK